MLTLDQLRQGISDVAAKVQAQTSIDQSTAALIRGLVDQNKKLADEIAGMSAGTVSQADIDAIVQQVRDFGSALDAGTAQLQAAVPANTAADPNTAPASSAPPASSQTPADASSPAPSSAPADAPASAPADSQPASAPALGAKPHPGANAKPINK